MATKIELTEQYIMKEIIVSHWCGTIKEFRNTYAEDQARQPYTNERRLLIVELVINSGYNVMLYQSHKTMHIFIDNKRFQQR